MIEANLHQQSRKEWMVPRSVVTVKSGRVYVLVTNVATKAVRIRPSECKFRARIISDDEADCLLEEKGGGKVIGAVAAGLAKDPLADIKLGENLAEEEQAKVLAVLHRYEVCFERGELPAAKFGWP